MAFVNATVDKPCSTTNDRIDPGSGNFSGDCGDTAFCSGPEGTSTCQPRLCRRDEFPFGFPAGMPLPPVCGDGFFCPDEGSGCRPQLPLGETCQLDRDEQCAPPPNGDLVSWRNASGSICLQSTCMYANVTLGQRCILDVATYTDGVYRNVVMRHNCQTPRFYCHPNLGVCVPTQHVGGPCASAQECRSFNCGDSGLCIEPPGTHVHVAVWQLVLTGLCILAAMVAIVIMLVLVHKRVRLSRYRELREYYEEQISLRKSLASLHSAAADHYSEKSSVYYD